LSKKHRHDDHEEHIDESWLIPYADLLTLLLALFIVLYSMNSVDVKKFEQMSQAFSLALTTGTGVLDSPSAVVTGSDNEKKKEDTGSKDKKNTQKETAALQAEIKQQQENLENLKAQIDQYIKEHGLTSDLETKLNHSQLMISISDTALFDPAKAEVKPDSKELAVAISKMLEQYPDYEVVVAGHTDTTPINTMFFKSNWDLSSMRAVRFMDILLENKNLNPVRFSAIGYGEYRPVADNDTVEGKAKNRRVELSIKLNFADEDNEQIIEVDTNK